MSKPAVIPRCQHIKLDGAQCGSPALRGKHFCYFHHRMRSHRDLSARQPRLSLPLLEDAASIQCALMQVITALTEGRLETRRAGLLLFALQTAAANLKNFRHTSEPEDLVRDLRNLETALDPDEFGEEYLEDEDEPTPQQKTAATPAAKPWDPEEYLRTLAQEPRYRGLIPQPDDPTSSTESKGEAESNGGG